jgi:hypothetical protein
MAGIVPISNAIFSDAPDFNFQSVTGVTGVAFHKFESAYVLGPSATLSLNDSHVYNIYINESGNKYISTVDTTIPGGEIIFIVNAGYINFSGANFTGGVSLTDGAVLIGPCSAKLILNEGFPTLTSNNKSDILVLNGADCCNNSKTLYQVGESFSTDRLIYTSAALLTLANTSAITEGPVIISGNAYNITEGVPSITSCATVDYNEGYVFYDYGGSSYTMYTNAASISYLSDDVKNYRWKTIVTSSMYSCASTNDVASGCYYRAYDPIYGPSAPATFFNGLIVDTLTYC